MEKNWNYILNIKYGLGEAGCTHPQACKGVFFSNFSFGKSKDFHAWAFLDLYRHLVFKGKNLLKYLFLIKYKTCDKLKPGFLVLSH